MSTETAPTLQVTWDDGGLAASTDSAPIVVGRSADAEVQLTHRSVSRKHLRLAFEDGRWVAIDESSRGTYDAAGGRVEQVVLDPGEVTLHLGAPDGPAIHLVTAEVVDDRTSMPAVPPLDTGIAWTVATTDLTLRLELDGRERMFTPPGRVVVGRDPGCDVVSDSGLVSREHVAFTNEGKGWRIEDLGSSRGTFVDGRRLRKRRRARGAFVAMLADADAGEPLRVVTAGRHKKPRRRGRVVVGAAAVVVAALIGTSVGLAVQDDNGNDAANGPVATGSDAANTERQLNSAARSTVRIAVLDSEGESMLSGSGIVLSDDGLILTNAHVADPLAYDFEVDEEPAGYGVFVVSDRSRPADPRYVADVVAVHPSVDAALLQVVNDADGQPVDAVELSALRIGDSDRIPSGTPAHQLGFPGLARSNEISIADVTIQSFRDLPSCADLPSSLEGSSCSDGAPLARGLMNVAGAELGPGSSGGPYVRKGELVALNVGRFTNERASQVYGIPVHTLSDWLAENGVAP